METPMYFYYNGNEIKAIVTDDINIITEIKSKYNMISKNRQDIVDEYILCKNKVFLKIPEVDMHNRATENEIRELNRLQYEYAWEHMTDEEKTEARRRRENIDEVQRAFGLEMLARETGNAHKTPFEDKMKIIFGFYNTEMETYCREYWKAVYDCIRLNEVTEVRRRFHKILGVVCRDITENYLRKAGV